MKIVGTGLMEGRLSNALVGLVFGLIGTLLFWLLAEIADKIIGKNIVYKSYYAIGIFSGFAKQEQKEQPLGHRFHPLVGFGWP